MSKKPCSISFKPAGKNKPCTTVINSNLVAKCDIKVNKCLNVKNIVYTTETINETGQTVSGEKSLTWINTCGTGVLADGIKDGFYKKIIKADENTEQILDYPGMDKKQSRYFGWSVSMSNDGKYAVVGAREEFDFNGEVYIYGLSGGTWNLLQGLTASDGEPADNFGYSVSIRDDGKTIAVGARQEDEKAQNAGAVYIYKYDGTSWTGEEKVTASNGATGDQFGYSVAISDDGNRLVVGAQGKDISGTNDVGGIYFYEYGGTSIGWTGEQIIDNPNTTTGINERFGWSVSMSNDGKYAVVGVPNWQNSSLRGRAIVYGLSGGSWTSIQELIASDGANFDQYAYSVSISGDGKYIAIGSIKEDTGVNNDGAVYVYEYDGTSWTNEEKIIASDGEQNDSFGGSVSLSSDGKYLIVGSSSEFVSSGRPGKAYIYYREDCKEDGQWIERKINNTDSPQNDDNFGFSVSISEDGCYSIVGQPNYNSPSSNNEGRAYIYNTNFYCLEYNDIDSILLIDEGDSACFVYNEDYGKWVKI
jgi:hypothetical protein